MDCFKDFNQESFAAHIQCITELERYSGKDYVAKASLNKGQRKQEAWVDLVIIENLLFILFPNSVFLGS